MAWFHSWSNMHRSEAAFNDKYEGAPKNGKGQLHERGHSREEVAGLASIGQQQFLHSTVSRTAVQSRWEDHRNPAPVFS